MSLLSNEDLLHLSSYLITGCLLLLVAFVCAAVAIRCCTKRLKRRGRGRYLLDPDLVREWALTNGGCDLYRCYNNASADTQLLIEAALMEQEQDVEFDNEVETVVCIDDATTATAETTKSNSGQDPSKGNAEKEAGEEEETSKAKLLSRAQRLLDNIGDGLLTKFNTNLISIPDEDVKGLEGRRDSINHREMDPIIRPKGHNAQILSVHTEAYDN